MILLVRSPAGLALLLVVVFLIVTRSILWTDHPPNFDFANFALGVHRFAPIDHQPHPPAYPLVILMARGFCLLGASAVRALQATALCGAIAAVFGAFWLGRRLSGEAGGILAALILAAEPVFGYSSLSSPTRVYLAAGVCWLLYCLMKLSDGHDRFLWITAVAAALCGGFRPELLLFFAIPFVTAVWLRGIPWRRAGAAAAVGAALCAPWILWVAWSFGSLFQMVYVYYHYFFHHISTTSAMVGAPSSVWRSMLVNSLLWNSFSTVLALAAIAISRKKTWINRRFLLLAGGYLAPALVVQLLVHEGADSPDHSLGSIAVFCVLAGSLLAAARAFWTAGLACAVLVAISLSPPGLFMPALDILSVRAFAAQQRSIAEIIAELRRSLRSRDAILVLNDSPVAGRIFEAEFPETVVIALDSTIQERAEGPPTGWRFHRRTQTPLAEDGISLAGVDRLQVFSNGTGLQREVLSKQTCDRWRCEVNDYRVEVELGSAGGAVVSLPPYTLRLAAGPR